eukprot:922459-Pleurochrysis_carterae.AAC.1
MPFNALPVLSKATSTTILRRAYQSSTSPTLRCRSAAPTTRSLQSQAGSAPAAATTAKTFQSTPSPLAPLTPDESKQFIFGPELIDAMDRKLVNAVIETMSSPAARRSYAEACAGSGRELFRLLVSEASSTSTAT